MNNNEVLVVDALSEKALLQLVEQKILVVRVPNFIDSTACQTIAAGLKKQGYNDYLNAPSVGRIGMSYFETAKKPEIIEHYFNNAIKSIHTLRQASYPFPCPMDTFRCVLDEAWYKGCTLQTLHAQKMFVGLSRSMQSGVPLLAHHDMFARHAPNTPEAASLLSQFAVNIYIDVPDVGGELAIWHDEISDEAFLERRGEKYGMDIEPLGEPLIKIKPVNGDLILFNARKLHAVLAGQGVDRLTISAFFGYRGLREPLTVWS